MVLKTTFAGAASLALLAGSVPIAVAAMIQPETAAQASPMEETVVRGEIVSVSTINNQFVIRTAGTPEAPGEQVAVRVTDDTSYTLDGDDSTMEEALEEGRRATATMSEGVAIRVAVETEED